MQLRRGADAELRHAADGAGDAGDLRHREDPRRLAQPAGFADIDVDDVGGPRVDDALRVVGTPDGLVHHDRNRACVAQPGEVFDPVGRQGLLDGMDAMRLQRLDHGERLAARAPTHIGVDPDRRLRTERPADRGGRLDVVLLVDADLDLHALEAAPDHFLGLRDHLLDRRDGDRHRQRRPHAHPAAEQVVDRGPERLAHDVVERHVDRGLRGIGGSRELDGAGHQLVGPVDVEGIEPDEGRPDEIVDDRAQRGTVAVPDHADLAKAGDAVIRGDPHDPEARVGRQAEGAAEGIDAPDGYWRGGYAGNAGHAATPRISALHRLTERRRDR